MAVPLAGSATYYPVGLLLLPGIIQVAVLHHDDCPFPITEIMIIYTRINIFFPPERKGQTKQLTSR